MEPKRSNAYILFVCLVQSTAFLFQNLFNIALQYLRIWTKVFEPNFLWFILSLTIQNKRHKMEFCYHSWQTIRHPSVLHISISDFPCWECNKKKVTQICGFLVHFRIGEILFEVLQLVLISSLIMKSLILLQWPH